MEVRIKKLKHPQAFIDYSQTIDDVYENLEDYNPTKKRKVLILFGDMIPDMEANKLYGVLLLPNALKRKKAQHFTCFYMTILFQSA